MIISIVNHSCSYYKAIWPCCYKSENLQPSSPILLFKAHDEHVILPVWSSEVFQLGKTFGVHLVDIGKSQIPWLADNLLFSDAIVLHARCVCRTLFRPPWAVQGKVSILIYFSDTIVSTVSWVVQKKKVKLGSTFATMKYEAVLQHIPLANQVSGAPRAL